ncbi:MAG: hypothetical protein B7Z03_07180 [Hydrogenophilales bacterium 32-62-9]|nr:MAG: hypothetical protein B7Z03_07180 [Hydrogenophilales bacterium 32-62-9]
MRVEPGLHQFELGRQADRVHGGGEEVVFALELDPRQLETVGLRARQVAVDHQPAGVDRLAHQGRCSGKA